jgi:putative PEP-CTERM system TPR-repeat lipoprotein
MPAVTSLAQLDLAEGKAPEARGRFEAVLSREPQNELALLGLAEVMARAKAPPAEVAAVLKRALAAAPQSVTARVALVDLLLLGGDARAALTVAQQAPPEAAPDLRMLDALGRSQFAAGETNQAIDSFRRAAVAEPRSIVPLVRLATVYASRKEHDKAAEVLARAQRLAPSDVTVARDLAAATAAMGKGDEALKQARALQASAPKSAAGFVLEGDLHFSARQWAAAERAYRDGLKLAPAAEPVAVKLHAAMLAAGRKADADAFARKWGADHPAAIVFQTYLGEQALRAHDAKAAVTHYEAVVARQPDNVAALNNLAWALGRIGDPRAIGYAQKALKAAPDNASVLDTMGVLLLAGGDPAGAGDVLARAAGLAPERHDIRLNYAKALIKAGRADEARQELMKLQRVTQDFAGKSEVAALLGN